MAVPRTAHLDGQQTAPREALKKMAMGQKFSGDQHWEQTM